MEKAAVLEMRNEVARLSSALQNTSKELDAKTRASARCCRDSTTC